jgi:VanZ family protein
MNSMFSNRYFAFRDHAFLKPLLVFFSVIVALEFLGNFFGFFHNPSLGYDKVLHFLGGVWWGIVGVGLLAVGFWNSPCELKTVNRRILILSIVAAFFIGILWEIAQAYFSWLRDASDYDWYDTIGDVIWDTIGGITAGLFYRIKE